MPTEIRRFANEMMNNPVRVEVTPVSTVASNIDEKVYYIAKGAKPQLLAHLVKDLPMHRAIVFMRTKHGADRIVRKLEAFGIRSAAIHGNKSQNNRSRALQLFKSDKIGVLVATDIAARGIDIDGVSHVINYDVTHEPETYVHRIGRTARAGASGVAISFCDHDERQNLTAIERLIKRKIALVPTPMADLPPAVADPRDGADRRYDDRERGPSHRTGGGVRNSSPRPSFIADRQPERSFGGERHSERAPARREPAQYMGDRRDTGDRREPSRNGGERREPSRGAAPRNYSSDRPAPRAYNNGGSNAPRPASPVKAKPRAFQAAPTAHVRHPLNGVKPTGAKQVHAQQVRSNGPVGSGTKKPHRKGQSRAPGRPHSHASR